MLIIFTVMFIVLYSLPVKEENQMKTYELDEKPIHNSRMLASYIDRTSVINIKNDTDFGWQAGNESWPGQGTWDDPYIIQNYNITNSSTCITIHDVSIHFVIRGCLVTADVPGFGDGISLDNVTHCYIEDCVILEKSRGIDLNDCNNALIDNCTIQDHLIAITAYDAFNTTIMNCAISNPSIMGDGVSLAYSDNSTLYNNTLTDIFGEMAAVYCDTSDFINLTENDITWNRDGVRLWDCDNALIFNNTINANVNEGINLDNCDNCKIQLNEIQHNQAPNTGIHAANSPYLLILNNDINNNYKGVWISDSGNCNLTNNHIRFNNDHGVEVSNSDDCMFYNNTIHDNGQDGLFLSNCDDCNLIKNEIFSNSWGGGMIIRCGVRMFASNRVNLTNNEIYDDANEGVYGYLSHNCTLFNNTIYENGADGVYIDDSDGWRLLNNTIHDNNLGRLLNSGVHIFSSHYTSLIGNEIYDDETDGVFIQSSDNCSLIQNDIHNNLGHGVHCEMSWNVTLIDNDLWHNWDRGLHFSDCINGTIYNNRIFDNLEDGIGLYGEMGSDNTTISYNVVQDNGGYGIDLSFSDNCSIMYNTISNSTYHGINLYESDSCILFDNTIYDNGWEEWPGTPSSGIYILLSDYCDIIGNEIYNNSQNGLYIEHCNVGTIINNTIYGNHGYEGDCGLWLYESDEWYIYNNTIFENLDYGISVDNCHYCDFIENAVHGNVFTGLYVRTANNWTILNNEIYDNGGLNWDVWGVYLWHADNATVTHNWIHNNTGHGIYMLFCDTSIVHDNELYDNGWTYPEYFGSGIEARDCPEIEIISNYAYNNSQHGIWIHTCDNATIFENTVYSNNGWGGVGCGLHVEDSEHVDVILNVAYNNTQNGIYGHGSNNCKYSNNTVYANTIHGIALEYSMYCNVTSNLIFDNGVHGCFLDGCESSLFVDNDIGWNVGGNAFDTNGNSNNWDDGIGLGNFWNDYDGGEDHGIPGSSGSVDHHPWYSLQIGSASDIDYELGSTGNTMNWPAFARHAWKWEAIKNGTMFDNSLWMGYNVMVDVDGFGVGYWNITLIVYHLSGHLLCDTAYANVTDTNAPTWSPTPTNQVSELGTMFSYDLDVTDHSDIDEWWLNTTDFKVNDDGVVANQISLNVGVYWIMVWVSDIWGNTQSASFKVTVVDTTAPAWNPLPIDQEVEFGENLYYDLNATDLSPIDTWWLNTTDFKINEEGLITNTVSLGIGVYWIQVSVNDTYGNPLTDTFKVTVGDNTEPAWIEEPEDQLVEFGDIFSYDLNATDLSSLDTWWLNTTDFKINEEGLITNTVTLSVGIYAIRVSVNDTSGNVLTDSFTVTVEDNTAPAWNPIPEDQEVEYGSPFRYNLNATDLSPITSWSVNDTRFAIDSNGILTNATLLPFGGYCVKVEVGDQYGNIEDYAFQVSVVDTTPPIFIATPDDVEVEEGTTVMLLWNISDLCPSSYTILVDGEVYTSGEWNSSMTFIVIAILDLEPGEYNVTITIEDCGGNTATDSVDIEVTEVIIPSTTTTTTSIETTTTSPPPGFPVDPTTLTLAIAGAGGAIAVIVIVIVLSKKRGS
jgi:parallel beta-helix repeat protein